VRMLLPPAALLVGLVLMKPGLARRRQPKYEGLDDRP
jgi:hypothetical protein